MSFSNMKLVVQDLLQVQSFSAKRLSMLDVIFVYFSYHTVWEKVGYFLFMLLMIQQTAAGIM